MAHSIRTMIKVGPASKALLLSLPAEFTKHQYNELRKAGGYDGMCFETARINAYIRKVREEPCKYKTMANVTIDPVTGRKFIGWDELRKAWSEELAEHFGLKPWDSYWSALGDIEPVEKDGYRNVYAVNAEMLRVFE